ncbi:MAG TPA: cytochrome c oxidase assembly protein [Solirubrobacteraceae bacterium]
MAIAPSPDASWTLEPGALALVAIVGCAYVRRWRAVRAEAGTLALPGWRAASFLAGLACVLVALVSPVDRLADQILTMHMVQHLLLLDLAPVLCLLGLTRVLLRPVTRRVHPVERRAGWLGHPVFAAVLYVATMWAWHVPALYDAALEHGGIHVLEHLCFTIAGGLYWWHLLGPIRSPFRLTGLAPIGYMVATKILVGLLGIGLTFSPNALYAFYEDQPRYWGLSAGTDQAVAGLVMALEQSIVMGIVLAWLFIRLLGEADTRDLRSERYARP